MFGEEEIKTGIYCQLFGLLFSSPLDSHETSFTGMISTNKQGRTYLSHNQSGNLSGKPISAPSSLPGLSVFSYDPVSRVMSGLGSPDISPVHICHQTGETERPPAVICIRNTN